MEKYETAPATQAREKWLVNLKKEKLNGRCNWYAYLKQCLVNFCIDRYLYGVDFLIEFRTMVVDIVDGDHNTRSWRQLRYTVVC